MATIVAFHAHPDDEVLLTGGTLARLAAEGNGVAIVLACSIPIGGAGAKGSERLGQLEDSARILGASRVVHLGYADGGHGPVLYPDPPGGVRFVRADLDEAAGRLADVLRAEQADVLLSYDPQGGYFHRDHIRVHEVGARAAELTGTRVLEATAPRELLRVLFLPVWLARLVVRYARQRQAALAAHASFTRSKGRSARLGRVLIALPVPVFAMLLGREWLAEPTA